MSDYVMKAGQGSMFRKWEKKNERAPDWNGKLNINGTEYWISGWDRTTTKGDTLISLSLGNAVGEKMSDKKASDYARPDNKQVTSVSLDDEIPF